MTNFSSVSSANSTMKVRIALLLACAISTACVPLSDRFDGSGKETIYALDGVKLISTSITTGDDPMSYQQRSYTVSSNDRLLMRFENLTASSTRIMSGKPVRIRIFAMTDAESSKAMTSLRICPLTKNWMMAATWQTAHPFKNGEWTPGGEIELEDCVSPDPSTSSSPTPAASLSPEPTAAAVAANPCAETGAICFDVSAWYNSYVIQRSINYGVALISYDGRSVRIYGDGAGSKGPRIHWIESTSFPLSNDAGEGM